MEDLPTLPTYLFEPTPQGILSLVLTVILPVVAGLLMKSSWPTSAKGVILLGVSAVKAFLEAWLAAVTSHEPFNAWGVAYAVLVNFAIAVLGYYALLKGTTLQQAALHGGIVKDRVIDGTAR